jgi:hypothetical protein
MRESLPHYREQGLDPGEDGRGDRRAHDLIQAGHTPLRQKGGDSVGLLICGDAGKKRSADPVADRLTHLSVRAERYARITSSDSNNDTPPFSLCTPVAPFNPLTVIRIYIPNPPHKKIKDAELSTETPPSIMTSGSSLLPDDVKL